MKKMLILSVILLCIVLHTTQASAEDVTYSWEYLPTGCCDKVALVGTLTSADFDQSADFQDAVWADFRYYYDLDDADRLGNMTRTYNCHGWIFLAFPGCLNYEETIEYHGTSPGCWEEDASGWIKSGGAHSCLVLNNTGKCGSLFLCKNNQNIYGTMFMPTQTYKQN